MPPTFIRCCPFCGSHDVEICRTNPLACWVKCDSCGAEAPSAPARKDAIAQWNRRHFDDVAATVVHDDERKS